LPIIRGLFPGFATAHPSQKTSEYPDPSSRRRTNADQLRSQPKFDGDYMEMGSAHELGSGYRSESPVTPSNIHVQATVRVT
jgi:hypothetical protein